MDLQLTLGADSAAAEATSTSPSSDVSEALPVTPAAARSELLQQISGVMLVTLVAPLILAGNAIVVYPFFRSRRVRTPTNQLVLCLAVSDIATGLMLPSFVALQSLDERIGNQLYSCLLPMAMLITSEVASILFMLAIAVDKVISLAKPLHYSEIVTKTGFYIFTTFTWTLSVMLGVSHVFVKLERPSSSPKGSGGSPGRCLSPNYPSLSTQTLFYALLVPAALVICLCYLYVYVVANKHARDIKQVEKVVRNKELGDSKHLSPLPSSKACMTATGSSQSGLRTALSSGAAQTLQASSVHHLAPPPSPASIQMNKGKVPRMSSSSRTSSCQTGQAENFNLMTSPQLSRTCASNSTSNARRRDTSIGSPGSGRGQGRQMKSYKYGMTLVMTVGSFMLCKFPAPLYFLLYNSNPEQSSPPQSDSISFFLLVPIFLGALVNPWLYAYHNLDLKPCMRRLFRQYLAGMGLVRAAERYVTRVEATYFSQWQGPPAIHGAEISTFDPQMSPRVPPKPAASMPAIVEMAATEENSSATEHQGSLLSSAPDSSTLPSSISELKPRPRIGERRLSRSLRVRPMFRGKKVLVESKSVGQLVLSSESSSSEIKIPLESATQRVLLYISTRVPTVTVWLEGEDGQGKLDGDCAQGTNM